MPNSPPNRSGGPERSMQSSDAMHIRLPTGSARVIVIGDVHGCVQELGMLLKACKYSPEDDVVVLVGDLLNKGPHSAQVVERACAGGFHAVIGNHDLIGLKMRQLWERTGQVPPADQHGSYEYVTALSAKEVQWLESLPLSIRLTDHADTLIVHAGLVPQVELAQQHPEHLYTMRNLLESNVPADSTRQGVPWASVWDGRLGGQSQHFVLFGHDAPRGLQIYPWAWGLDTNCCNGGRLTACILPSRELVSVPGLGKLHQTATAREWRRIAEPTWRHLPVCSDQTFVSKKSRL